MAYDNGVDESAVYTTLCVGFGTAVGTISTAYALGSSSETAFAVVAVPTMAIAGITKFLEKQDPFFDNAFAHTLKRYFIGLFAGAALAGGVFHACSSDTHPPQQTKPPEAYELVL